jgi:hypothetical protein
VLDGGDLMQQQVTQAITADPKRRYHENFQKLLMHLSILMFTFDSKHLERQWGKSLHASKEPEVEEWQRSKLSNDPIELVFDRGRRDDTAADTATVKYISRNI